ncbi:MAG TPA: adenosylcobinamide-phosphate synthase CbiB [Methanocorpusculum sp.]|nr:adenosylcobinamide-phosphate synthase CbiB [Methanocorpusculum sp.]
MAFGALILFFGLLLDRIIGDPQSRFHPVALIGSFIGLWGRRQFYSPKLERLIGILGWIVTVAICLIPCLLIARFTPTWVFVLFSLVLLSFTIGWRSLEEHVFNVETALAKGETEGRIAVSRMVSRNTESLTLEQIRSGAYESAAENLVDSIIAPIFWFVVFELLFGLGICGAVLFRAANTMDAMLGYRDDRIRLGWFPARMDDILAFIPARITGLILLLIFAVRRRGKEAVAAFKRDRRKRPGFNGGIPMSLIAGGCGVCFDKPGVYLIGTPERSLEDGGKSIIRVLRAATIIAGIIGIILMLIFRTPVFPPF